MFVRFMQAHKDGCSCHLNAGDSASTSSPLCRNESLHSPQKQRCGLHCIQRISQLRSTNPATEFPPPLPGVQTSSTRPPLPPREFLTPSSHVQPPGSSSSSELVGSQQYENVTSPTSQTSESSSSSDRIQNGQKLGLEHGVAG